MSPQGSGYDLAGSDQFWYHPGATGRQQDYETRSSSTTTTGQASSNYAMYGSSRATTSDVGFSQHHDTAIYAGHAQYGDGRQQLRTPHQLDRKLHLETHGSAAGPWSPTEITDKGTIAAQQCMNTLFPELLGMYSPANEANEAIFGRGLSPSDYYDGSQRSNRHQSSRSRGSPVAERDFYHRQRYSENIHSGPIHSPALEGLPFSSSAPSYHKAFDQYSDASDSDSDSAYPHMMVSTSPHGSVDTFGTGTPMTSKYPSPELMDSAAYRHQHQYSYDGNSPPRRHYHSSSNAGLLRPRSDTEMPPAETLKHISLSPDAYDRNDAWLVHYRMQSIPYKNIKAILNLDEAESTLRGRYRTLIKPKNQRLRRPPWTEKDKELLLGIVDPDSPNIKWKQVSEYIHQNGGSYQFGSSTCKKQYNQLVTEGRAKPLSESANATKRSSKPEHDGYHQTSQHHHHYYPTS
ncbi:hypothetical protein EX30DRAFT_349871 [Ascodesmis nigricans]|uniref:Myb-like domain-containing protein n=1 Tax=Ascodesmis nigricans TaxID=341454 RepID=A0A4S2MTP7_9PEZI|nr:hypothetical protein EX30DRAFT_349871 [Ascodesmis nigricans]